MLRVARAGEPIASEGQDVGEGIRELTSAVARGDEGAFDRLHDLVSGRLRRYLVTLARGDLDLAADAQQETLLRMVRYLKVMDSEEVLWGWLRRTARTALIDQLRRGKRHAAAGSLPQELARDLRRPAAVDPDDELLGILEELLTGLSAEEKALVHARYWNGTPVPQLAEEGDVSVRAAESRLSRVRRKLREKMLRRLGHV